MGPDGDTLRTYRYNQEEGGPQETYLSVHPHDFRLFAVDRNDPELKTREHVEMSETGEMLLKNTWQYDENNQIVLYSTHDTEKKEMFTWRIQYNNKGLPEISQVLKNNIPIRVERYLYDYH